MRKTKMAKNGSKRKALLKAIAEVLRNYHLRFVPIEKKLVPMYEVPAWNDGKRRDGIIPLIDPKPEFAKILQKYKPPKEGWAARLSILIFGNTLRIYDHRRQRYVKRRIPSLTVKYLNALECALAEPTEENLARLFES